MIHAIVTFTQNNAPLLIVITVALALFLVAYVLIIRRDKKDSDFYDDDFTEWGNYKN